MLQRIRLTVLIKILCFVLLVFGEDCSEFNQWCPHKSQHIMCAKTLNPEFEASTTNIDTFLYYLNKFKQNNYCSRLNNKKTRVSGNGVLSIMALKSLRHNLVNTNICYATRADAKIIEIYQNFDSCKKSEDSCLVYMFKNTPHIISLVGRGIGCADNSTGVLCLLSVRDPFIKFSNFAPIYKQKCGVDYSELNSNICYLNDETIKSIVVGMTKSAMNKFLKWSERLEYLAHCRVIFSGAKLCDSDNSIDIQIKTTDYNITTIANDISNNQNFDAFVYERKVHIGCAVYSMKPNSVRILCLYNNEDMRNSGRLRYNLQTAFGFKYFLYLWLVLVYFNIFTISIYLIILLKFIHRRKPTMEELYEMHEYSYMELFPPQTVH